MGGGARALLGGIGCTCKQVSQCGKPRNHCSPRCPLTGFTLCMRRGHFGQGKKYIWIQGNYYTYRPLRAPGGCSGVDCRDGLDDDIPIRKVLHLGMHGLLGARLPFGSRIKEKNVILVASLYLHLFQSFPVLEEQEWWMGLTGFGCLSKIGRSYQVIVLFLISCSGSGIALNRLIIPRRDSSWSVLRYMK